MKVLVVQPLHPEAIRLLEQRSDVAHEVATDTSEANLLARVADADAITIRDAPLPPSVLRAATRLRVIARHGVGYDNIPVAECSARGIPVAVVGPVNVVSVAEQTLLLMLAAARGGMALDAAVRRGDFAARGRIAGVELRGRTLLLLGYGRIGREVGRLASALGMRVVAHDPHLAGEPEPGVERIDALDDALARAEVLSLHLPLAPATRGLIGAAALARLPEGAIVVNAARGGILDEGALLDAVRSGRLHGAGLDTFEREPLPADSPLLGEPRIALSPHSAALTAEALLRMGLATVRNALAGLDGALDPALVVNPEVLRRAG